ncbi:DUF3304 domain-containing protein [Klebsiella pneumoniae]
MEKGIDAQKRQHSKTVPLPDYNGQDVCGITVHFLPCDDVKVTTSCWSPRNANYPIKEPVRMKEPAVCPKPAFVYSGWHHHPFITPKPTGRVQ